MGPKMTASERQNKLLRMITDLRELQDDVANEWPITNSASNIALGQMEYASNSISKAMAALDCAVSNRPAARW